MNATIEKFGYPATLVRDYAHWTVLLRPQQPTLGSLVLAAKSQEVALGALPPHFHAELAQVTRDLETALKVAVDYARINYLMLMMVDPHVHFHVIPRYEGMRGAEGVRIEDAGWPKLPDLGSAHLLSETEMERLATWLKGLWPA
jgi:diadenosine tetraphosphate (Ap4A) HIT family hydrolase